jgi:hypothetical protein
MQVNEVELTDAPARINSRSGARVTTKARRGSEAVVETVLTTVREADRTLGGIRLVHNIDAVPPAVATWETRWLAIETKTKVHAVELAHRGVEGVDGTHTSTRAGRQCALDTPVPVRDQSWSLEG